MNKIATKEKWYYHEMIVCTLIVLGIFGLMFTLIHFGVKTEYAAEIGVGILFGVMLLPLIGPITDVVKWIKKKRTESQSGKLEDKK